MYKLTFENGYDHEKFEISLPYETLEECKEHVCEYIDCASINIRLEKQKEATSMTVLSYVCVGKGKVQINFACDTDAKCIADELVKVPGIVDIKINDKIWEKPHYMVLGRGFQRFEDAVRFAEQHLDYVIEDMYKGMLYTPMDIELLGF